MNISSQVADTTATATSVVSAAADAAANKLKGLMTKNINEYQERCSKNLAFALALAGPKPNGKYVLSSERTFSLIRIHLNFFLCLINISTFSTWYLHTVKKLIFFQFLNFSLKFYKLCAK